jgi:SAM-dependent methyltransferase
MTDLDPGSGLRERVCPVCGSDRARVRAAARIDVEALDEYAYASRKTPELMHHRLLACAECGTVYASPAPSPEALNRAYGPAAYDSQVEAEYAASTYIRGLRAMLGVPQSWEPVLDIGAGDGAFLAGLQELGATEFVGVEPSEAPIEAAQASIRARLRQGVFEAGDFKPESFALITCFQTIEHVPDPLALCSGAHALLRPGGSLAIVCHDYRALPNRLMGRRSPIYDIEHMQLLSRAPVRVLLERSGFSSVSVRRLVNRYPLRYWLRLAPIPAGPKRWLLGALSERGGSVPVPLPVGNLLAVATKRARA